MRRYNKSNKPMSEERKLMARLKARAVRRLIRQFPREYNIALSKETALYRQELMVAAAKAIKD